MAHFDERFDRQNCRGMCDSCAAIAAGVKFETTDLTSYAKGMVDIVKSTPEGIGIGLLIDVFRGSSAKTVTSRQYNRLPGYGIGKTLDKSEAERMARAMVLRGYFSENSIRSEGGMFATTVTTIHCNHQRCQALQQGREVFNLYIKQRATSRKDPVPITVVTMDPHGTQPSTQSGLNQYLDESLAPDRITANAKEQEMCLAVFNALSTWRIRMVNARSLQKGAPVNADNAFPPNLLELLKVARPCTEDAMKVFSDSLTNAKEVTAMKKYYTEIIGIIAQAVECKEKDIPNPYVGADGRQEDEPENDEEREDNDESDMDYRRKSIRLSQALSADIEISPAWKKARRSQG